MCLQPQCWIQFVIRLCSVCRCWEKNVNMGYWWIIRSPILFAYLVRHTEYLYFAALRVLKVNGNSLGMYYLLVTRLTGLSRQCNTIGRNGKVSQQWCMKWNIKMIMLLIMLTLTQRGLDVDAKLKKIWVMLRDPHVHPLTWNPVKQRCKKETR